jgi:hypothetical protein
MTTTMGFSQNGFLINELYKKESFKYSFLKYKDNLYTLEQAGKDFFQIVQDNIDSQETDSEDDELEDIEYMLF